ncbi:MAG: hypothetical protein HRU41_06080 [Saprospiraceae bacterium]|nr:hypothetical protein [Saprospiraceae bacterium]
MITLSDYLGYIHQELLKARQLADQAAVDTAQRYAKDEYLKYFRAPRFTMPNVKLKLPVRIDSIDQETKYDFKLEEERFIDKLNSRLTDISRKHGQPIELMTPEKLRSPEFQSHFRRLEKRDNSVTGGIDNRLPPRDTRELLKKTVRKQNFGTAEGKNESLDNAIAKAFDDTIKEQYRPVKTNIHRLEITPETSSMSPEDNEKLLLHLELELVEEGLMIRKVTDENGNEVEQITVD